MTFKGVNLGLKVLWTHFQTSSSDLWTGNKWAVSWAMWDPTCPLTPVLTGSGDWGLSPCGRSLQCRPTGRLIIKQLNGSISLLRAATSERERSPNPQRVPVFYFSVCTFVYVQLLSSRSFFTKSQMIYQKVNLGRRFLFFLSVDCKKCWSGWSTGVNTGWRMMTWKLNCRANLFEWQINGVYALFVLFDH